MKKIDFGRAMNTLSKIGVIAGLVYLAAPDSETDH